MAVGMLQEFDATAELYDAVTEKLNVESDPPEGMLVHTAGAAENGKWRIFDIWESREAFERFAQDRLGPAVREVAEQHGIEPPPPEQEIYELHNVIKG